MWLARSFATDKKLTSSLLYIKGLNPTLKVASLEIREENMCVSSSIVVTPTAFGMILAVFSLVMLDTEIIGIWI